jgi:DNA repair protein RadD
MINLRGYQIDLIDDARAALRKHQRVVLQAPTGAGKTAITVHMMGEAARRGKRSMFCVHQNELLQQTSRALWLQKLEHGQIASGKGRSPLPAQVASVMTLVNRLDQYEPPDLIIIDEAHRAASTTYQRVLQAYPDAAVIGLTATPQRTDGKGLSDLFGGLVVGPSVRSLIDAGYLSDYEILAPASGVDLSGVKTRAGDYDKAEVEKAVDRPTITGHAVDKYQQYAAGKRCVVMCATLRHAAHVADEYNARGIRAEMIEGGMTNAQREEVLARFAAGDTLVICNVQLLIEGVDIPAIQAVQWLRPTKSLIVWMQGIGRGLRPAPGKDRLIVLDQVGNWERHGLPDDEREWSLEGRKARKRKADDAEPDVHVQQCKACFAVFRPGVAACPRCGAPVELKQRKELEVVDGELAKVERVQRRKEQGSARDLGQLIDLGRRRGMKNPAAWAVHVFADRQGRKPTAADFAAARAVT